MMNRAGSSDGERVKRAFKVIGKEVDTIIDSFTSDAPLGVLEGSAERLLEIIKSLPENTRSESAVYIIERLLKKYTLYASPMWSTYLNYVIAEIVAIDSTIAKQVIDAIVWEMASETDPRILLNLKEALSLDGMIKDSSEISNYMQLQRRASKILHGMKDMIEREDLKKNLKPLLAEKISIIMGLEATPQGLRILALKVLFREGLLDDDDLEAMMLHEIMHAERGDEKIWPELVRMADKQEATKKVWGIEYEVDRRVIERLMEYGRDPEAYLRLLEKSGDLIRRLAQEGHLKLSSNPMAIPTPPIKDRIKNIKRILAQKGVFKRVGSPEERNNARMILASHFSLLSKNNALSSGNDEPTTELFGMGDKKISVATYEEDMKSVGGFEKTIIVKERGEEISITFRGSNPKGLSLQYLTVHPFILKDAVMRSKELYEGNLPENITIILADKYDYLAGDHKDNNVVIINASLLEKMLWNGKDYEFIRELITAALSEEFAHERGAGSDNATEKMFSEKCAIKSYREINLHGYSDYIAFIEQYGKDSSDYIRALKAVQSALYYPEKYSAVVSMAEEMKKDILEVNDRNQPIIIILSGQEGSRFSDLVRAIDPEDDHNKSYNLKNLDLPLEHNIAVIKKDELDKFYDIIRESPQEEPYDLKYHYSFLLQEMKDYYHKNTSYEYFVREYFYKLISSKKELKWLDNIVIYYHPEKLDFNKIFGAGFPIPIYVFSFIQDKAPEIKRESHFINEDVCISLDQFSMNMSRMILERNKLLHSSLLSKRNRFSKQGEAITDNLRIGAEEINITDKAAIENIPILGTIGPNETGIDLILTVRGSDKRKRLSDYLSKDIYILRKAIERSVFLVPGSATQHFEKNITIILADKHDYLAGDHKQNNIIILNASDLEEMILEENPVFVSELLASILSEEFSHERGAKGDPVTEEKLAKEGAFKSVEYLKEYHNNLGLSGYVSFIEKYADGTFVSHVNDAENEVKLKGLGNQAFNKDELKKISQLEARVKENVKLLREKFKLGPDYFTQRLEEEGVLRMIEYMELTGQGLYIGYGDMKKISFLNKAFVTGVVDRLIPLMTRAANYILSQDRYMGLVARTTGDEMALGLKPELSEKEVNNIRLELQYTLSEFIPYYGFVKLNGVTDDNVDIIKGVLEKDGVTDIYKDEDGFFLVFKRREAGDDLNASCKNIIEYINTAVERIGFEISRGSSPIEIPSPRVNFGIIKREIENSEDPVILHAEYGKGIKYAEYIHSISEQNGLNGGTAHILERFDDFSNKMPEATIPRLSGSEQEMRAKTYSDELGSKIHPDQLEEYYPAIKREYLHTIIENMPSSQPGAVFLIRGPPDNFYIAANLGKGYFSLLRIEFLYKPYGAFKTRVNNAKRDALKKGEDIESALRERWPENLPEWYGFKIINDYLTEGQSDHAKGNEVISAIAEVLNAQKGYLAKPGMVTETGPKNFAREVREKVIARARIPSDVKVIVGMLTMETEELKEKGPGTFIKIADDLTRVAMPLPRSDNLSIVNVYDPARKDEFHNEVSEYRGKEREKFQPLLKKAYDEPVLTRTDLAEYTLAEDLLYEMSDSLIILMESWDTAFNLDALSNWFDRLETSLALSKPENIELLKLKMDELDPKTIARIAYNTERFNNEKNVKFPNLREIFSIPGFYKDNALAELSIISYMATYLSIEELAAADFGAFKLIEKPFKKGEDYVFKFIKENTEYTVRLKKDFSLELEGVKAKSNMAKYLDETACAGLSRRIVEELDLARNINEFSDDTRLRCGSKEYAWEQWKGVIPKAGRSDSRIASDGVYFVRVGHLFFLDNLKYQNLSGELKEGLGANVILIKDLDKTELGNRSLFSFTVATIAAMMGSDIAKRRVIDAGAGSGILSLVAAKLGALEADLIENDDITSEKAAYNLKINGLGPDNRYRIINADLLNIDNIVSSIGTTDLDTVIVSNIGTWPEIYGNVTNADSMKLITSVPNVKLYIGGGYSLGSIEESLRGRKNIILYKDMMRMEIEYDFSVTMDSIARFEAYLQETYLPNAAFIGIFKGQRDFDAQVQVKELFEGQEALRTAN